jgi:geranylgeranyl transferase type-2 subunit alpha
MTNDALGLLISIDWHSSQPLHSSDDVTANQIYTNELDFVQENLKLNPKSYWMWNHRRWCLEHMSQPRWDRELGMVNKFLEIDARNCREIGIDL